MYNKIIETKVTKRCPVEKPNVYLIEGVGCFAFDKSDFKIIRKVIVITKYASDHMPKAPSRQAGY